jgi:HEAT repeat protein
MLLASRAATARITHNDRTVKEWALQLYGAGGQHEEALTALHALGEKAVPDLVRLLGKSELPFRSQVRGALPELPAAMRPLVLRLYGKTTAAEIKIAAARALGFLGAKARSAGQALENRMRDKDPAVASEAGVALAKVSPNPLRQFQSALRDRKSSARRAAAYALGGLGAQAGPAVPGLLERLNDPDPLVRESAEGSLSRIGAAAIPAMLEFIVRERSPTRERLAEMLITLYSGPLPQRPQLAELKLDSAELGNQRAEILQRLSASHRDPVMSRVLAAMLNDPDATVRVAAIKSVHGDRVPGVVLALIRRLKDQDANVRAEAARALGVLGDAGRPALFSLRRMAADEQEPVRMAASEALQRIEGAIHQERE